jgi:lysozyme
LKDIAKHQAAVNRMVTRPLWALQADSLISWTFNLGPARLASSTMLKRVNARRDADVPGEIRKWVYAGDKKWLGLVLRRDAEAFLYEREKP